MQGSISLVSPTNSMFILLKIVLFATLTIAEIPPYVQVCGRRNPQLNDCVLNSVKAILQRLKNGLPEINVPPVEPLNIDRMKLIDLPTFQASASDVKLYGLSGVKINKLNVDLKKQRISLNLVFKEVILDADYHVNARILFPVAGSGPINIVATDVISTAVLNYKIIEHKGKKYMYFWEMTLKLFLKDYTSNFRPKEGPDSTLATAINAALISSRKELIENTTPHLEKKITEVVLTLANKICKSFTYDELFPDRE